MLLPPITTSLVRLVNPLYQSETTDLMPDLSSSPITRLVSDLPPITCHVTSCHFVKQKFEFFALLSPYSAVIMQILIQLIGNKTVCCLFHHFWNSPQKFSCGFTKDSCFYLEAIAWEQNVCSLLNDESLETSDSVFCFSTTNKHSFFSPYHLSLENPCTLTITDTVIL